jgi:hypothetical protein
MNGRPPAIAFRKRKMQISMKPINEKKKSKQAPNLK